MIRLTANCCFDEEKVKIIGISDVMTCKATGLRLLRSFCCSSQGLNEFLVDDAVSYDRRNITKTWLAIYDNEIIGFFSLSSDSLQLGDIEKEEMQYSDNEEERCAISYLPAVKLTKLAVSEHYERCGVGSYLVRMVKGMLYELPIAVRFITLDAVNEPNVIRFYEKCGFSKTSTQNKAIREKNRLTVLMHKDLHD